MYMVLAVIFVCIFFDLDPAKSFPLRLAARAVTQQLGKLIEANVKTVNMTGWVANLVDGRRENHSPLKDYGVHMIRKLLESGLGVNEVTWSQILPTATAMVANQAQVVRLPHFRTRQSRHTDKPSSRNCLITISGMRVKSTYLISTAWRNSTRLRQTIVFSTTAWKG